MFRKLENKDLSVEYTADVSQTEFPWEKFVPKVMSDATFGTRLWVS